MADHKKIVIYVLLLLYYTRCDLEHPIRRRVKELNDRSIKMYGKATKEYIEKNIDVEDRLLYPRGDKRKLSVLSQLWRDYYACADRLLDKLTASRQLPSVTLMVYQGAVARLQCLVCVAPGERRKLQWMYAESTENNFTEIDEHDRMVLERGNLTIYNVMAADAGAYRCQVGASAGGLLLLEVVGEEEPYIVVKPPESRGPHSIPPEKYNGVTLFNLWTPWSECSVCGKVGRRHRYGLCYVNLTQTMITNTNKSIAASNDALVASDNNLTELFQAFPGGIPCRSQYLPDSIRRINAVQQRASEIMIGMCKVPCEESIPATNGTLGDNNTRGTYRYSLTQRLPKQPPLPARDTIYADFGQPLAIQCPGTTLRDVPIVWRIGRKVVVPLVARAASRGRLHVSCTDRLVFTAVLYRDNNLYSCWQSGNLAGTVKLIVWEGAHAHWAGRGALLLLLAAVACATQRVRTPRSAAYSLH